MATTSINVEWPYLDDLPFHLKDDILGFIDDPRHLIAMALANKEWASMIIPHHLDYRALSIAWPGDQRIWAHLALRADLAQNIRSVRLIAGGEQAAFERLPRTLMTPAEDPDSEAPQECTVFGPDNVHEIVEALHNLKALMSFTWCRLRAHSLYVNPIFEALKACPDLEELHLMQMSTRLDNVNLENSILTLSKLKKLTLHGRVWANFFEVHDKLADFIERSPYLEELTVSFNPLSIFFASCTLSHLTKLHLYADSNIPGAHAQNSDTTILNFIVSHPLIEDLRWYPRDEHLELPQGVLPNLRRLHTKDRIAKTLLYDHTVEHRRRWEALSQISLGPNTMNLFRTMDGAHLHELHLWRFEDLEQISELATMFPNIRILDVPTIIQAGRNTADDCIETLARFRRLERFLDSSLWLAMHSMPQIWKQETMNSFGRACPNLRTLRHWRRTNNMPWDLVISREGGQVRWEERLDASEESILEA